MYTFFTELDKRPCGIIENRYFETLYEAPEEN